MAYYSSIIQELDASRRLESELAFEKHQQELQRTKIEKQLQNLRRSRKEYIESQINQSKMQYEKQLKEDKEVSQEHSKREQRQAQEKAKIAQGDFEKERERLWEEKNEHEKLEKEYGLVGRALLDLKTKSRIAQENEERRIFELETRKKTVIKLLQESRERERYHFERGKQLKC